MRRDGAIAIVTGAEHPTGLGSGRALHRVRETRVWGIARSLGFPACRSRVWQELRVMSGAPSQWVDSIRGLGETLDRPAFLLPTQDGLVSEISRRRHELLDGFRFVLPEHEVVETFLDKTKFHVWGERHGFPVPASYVVRSSAEFEAALRTVPFPLVVKPLFRTPEWSRLSPVEKVLHLETEEEADHLPFDLFAAAPSFIVSQWIPGPDSEVHYCLAYCDQPGRIMAAHTGRKLLQYPRRTGSTAICVGTDNGELRELTEAVFGKAKMHGLGSLEVKYAPDGKPVIMEPTIGRPNLQSYSAVAAGCNLHALAMYDALDLPTPPRAGRPRNCFWIEEGAVRELAAGTQTDPVPWGLLGRELVRARRLGGAYWAWWDPMPLVLLLRDTMWRVTRRCLRWGRG